MTRQRRVEENDESRRQVNIMMTYGRNIKVKRVIPLLREELMITNMNRDLLWFWFAQGRVDWNF